MFLRLFLSVSAFFLLFVLQGVPVLAAENISVQLLAPTEDIVREEPFILRLVVQGSQNTSLASETIQLPPEFVKQGTSQSSRITVINGTMNSELEFDINILPKKTGTFSLGPAVLTLTSGEQIMSNTVPVTVIPPPEVRQKDALVSSSESAPRDAVSVHSSSGKTTGFLLVGIGVIAALFSLLLVLSRKKSRVSEKVLSEHLSSDPPKMLLPHVSEDDAVFAQKLLSAIRIFITHQEGISAEEMTSRELLNTLRERSSPLLSEVEPLFEILDGALFARKPMDKTNLLRRVNRVFSSFSSHE